MRCTTTLTDSVKLTSEFWRSLLVLDGSAGWLETNHLFAWESFLYNSRLADARWFILPPWFQQLLLNYDQCPDLATGFNPPYPAIRDVDHLYFPVNVKDQHWILLHVNLLEWTITIYDSLKGTYDLDIFFITI
ncbi:hypothetical protein R6Q59_025529 [Mikania micrantha]